MKNYRPILVQDLQLQLPGLKVNSFRLNRVAPEAQLRPHKHDDTQIILFLDGNGNVTIDGELFHASAGSTFYIKPGALHNSERKDSKIFTAAYINIDLEAGRDVIQTNAQINAADLNQCRASLKPVYQFYRNNGREAQLRTGAAILTMLDVSLRAIGWSDPQNRFSSAKHYSATRIAQRAIDRYVDEDITVEELAQKIGWQPEHINRTLKEECGMTLGQLRARQRLRKSQQLILENYPFNVVAKMVGIDDNNYFSRWFRKHTGMSPREWKQNPVQIKEV